jgi:hypothetical protein
VDIQDVLNQAASVADQTGVDPSIIATIASTESNLSLAPPFTLGITTMATRGGAGSSGGSLRSHSAYAGTSQPAAFWSYNDGAEAAQAFADYINAYQPGLAPLLGDASAFFDPSGPIISSNYYVPTPGGTSAADYYGHWRDVALSLGGTAVAAVGGAVGGFASSPSGWVILGGVALALWLVEVL